MAKKIRSDDLDLDLDNLDLGDDGFGFDDAPSEKDRKPINRIKAGALESFNLKQGGEGRSHLGRMIRAVLPKEYTEAYDELTNVKSSVREVYDASVSKFQPTMRIIKSGVRKIEPVTTKFTPNIIGRKIKSFSTEPEDDNSYNQRMSEDDARRAADNGDVTSTLQTIFGAQRISSNALEARNDVHRNTDRLIARKEFEVTTRINDKIASGIGRLVGYQDNVLSRYYQKSLELQFLHYFATRDLLNLSKASESSKKTQLDAITKNTALPNEVKLNMNEQFVNEQSKRIIGSVQEAASKKIGKYPSMMFKQLGKNISDALDFTNDMTSQLQQGLEMQMEMNGGEFDAYRAGANQVSNRLRETAGARINKKIRAYINPEGEPTTGLQRMVQGTAEKFGKWMDPGYIGRWINSKAKADPFGILGSLASQTGTLSTLHESVQKNLATDATKSVGWDLISRRSLIEIIPGYLSRILEQNTKLTIKMGAKDTKVDRVVYDVNKEDFTTLSSAQNTFKKNLKNQVSPLAVRNAKEFIKIMQSKNDPSENLTPEEEKEFALFLFNEAQKNDEFNPNSYLDSSFLQRISPNQDTQEKISRSFTTSILYNPDKREANKNERNAYNLYNNIATYAGNFSEGLTKQLGHSGFNSDVSREIRNEDGTVNQSAKPKFFAEIWDTDATTTYEQPVERNPQQDFNSAVLTTAGRPLVRGLRYLQNRFNITGGDRFITGLENYSHSNSLVGPHLPEGYNPLEDQAATSSKRNKFKAKREMKNGKKHKTGRFKSKGFDFIDSLDEATLDFINTIENSSGDTTLVNNLLDGNANLQDLKRVRLILGAEQYAVFKKGYMSGGKKKFKSFATQEEVPEVSTGFKAKVEAAKQKLVQLKDSEKVQKLLTSGKEKVTKAKGIVRNVEILEGGDTGSNVTLGDIFDYGLNKVEKKVEDLDLKQRVKDGKATIEDLKVVKAVLGSEHYQHFKEGYDKLKENKANWFKVNPGSVEVTDNLDSVVPLTESEIANKQLADDVRAFVEKNSRVSISGSLDLAGKKKKAKKLWDEGRNKIFANSEDNVNETTDAEDAQTKRDLITYLKNVNGGELTDDILKNGSKLKGQISDFIKTRVPTKDNKFVGPRLPEFVGPHLPKALSKDEQLKEDLIAYLTINNDSVIGKVKDRFTNLFNRSDNSTTTEPITSTETGDLKADLINFLQRNNDGPAVETKGLRDRFSRFKNKFTRPELVGPPKPADIKDAEDKARFQILNTFKGLFSSNKESSPLGESSKSDGKGFFGSKDEYFNLFKTYANTTKTQLDNVVTAIGNLEQSSLQLGTLQLGGKAPEGWIKRLLKSPFRLTGKVVKGVWEGVTKLPGRLTSIAKSGLVGNVLKLGMGGLSLITTPIGWGLTAAKWAGRGLINSTGALARGGLKLAGKGIAGLGLGLGKGLFRGARALGTPVNYVGGKIGSGLRYLGGKAAGASWAGTKAGFNHLLGRNNTAESPEMEEIDNSTDESKSMFSKFKDMLKSPFTTISNFGKTLNTTFGAKDKNITARLDSILEFMNKAWGKNKSVDSDLDDAGGWNDLKAKQEAKAKAHAESKTKDKGSKDSKGGKDNGKKKDDDKEDSWLETAAKGWLGLKGLGAVKSVGSMAGKAFTGARAMMGLGGAASAASAATAGAGAAEATVSAGALGATGLGASVMSGAATVGALLLTYSTPIGWALLAGAGVYAGYKGYKAIQKRGALLPLEKLRFLQYGLPIDNTHVIPTVRYFEEYMVDRVVLNNNGVPKIDLKEDDLWDEFASEFGCDKDDKVQRKAFMIWFYKRFIPVFVKHSVVSKVLGNFNLLSIDKDLPKDLKFKFISDINFTDKEKAQGLDPFSVTTSPWPDIALNDNTETIKTLTTQLTNELKRGIDTKAGNVKDIKPTKPELLDPNKSPTKALDAKTSLMNANKASQNAGGSSFYDRAVNWTSNAIEKGVKGAKELYGKSVDWVSQKIEAVASNKFSKSKSANWNDAKPRLESAANKVGVDAALLSKIANFESSFNSEAIPFSRKANKVLSSAHGYGQFLDGTWNAMIKKYGKKHGLDPSNPQQYRHDKDVQALMLAEFTNENVQLGRKYGGVDDAANVYALHNLGSGGGIAFLQALKTNPNAPVNTVKYMTNSVIFGNPSLYKGGNISIAEAYQNMSAAMNQGGSFSSTHSQDKFNFTGAKSNVSVAAANSPSFNTNVVSFNNKGKSSSPSDILKYDMTPTVTSIGSDGPKTVAEVITGAKQPSVVAPIGNSNQPAMNVTPAVTMPEPTGTKEDKKITTQSNKVEPKQDSGKVDNTAIVKPIVQSNEKASNQREEMLKLQRQNNELLANFLGVVGKQQAVGNAPSQSSNRNNQPSSQQRVNAPFDVRVAGIPR